MAFRLSEIQADNHRDQVRPRASTNTKSRLATTAVAIQAILRCMSWTLSSSPPPHLRIRLGIALGIGLTQLVAAVSPLPASIAPWSLFVAVALGGGVGIVAGAYPASRAAKLDPIVALRSE